VTGILTATPRRGSVTPSTKELTVARIGPDRALIDQVTDDGTAVLRVGPGGTEVHVPVEALPEEAGPGTWVIVDAQIQPPMVVGVDEELTRASQRDA
jgi:hypothetical protein